MRTSKKIQKKTNFQNLKIGKEPLPPIDYNTSLSSYKDNYEDMVGRAFYEVPLEEDIEYCTNRMEFDTQDDFPYASTYSGIPPFENQYSIKFGEQSTVGEIRRKYYFLKYYFTYNSGFLYNTETHSGLDPISGDVSVFNNFDLNDTELSALMKEMTENNLKSFNPVEPEITIPTLSSSDTNGIDTLEEFEREYQAFIEELKKHRNEN